MHLVNILVIDNNNNDITFTRVNKLCQNLGLIIKVIKEDRLGLSFARNKALNCCETPYALFLDDDCYPAEDVVTQCIKWLEDDKFALVFGKVLKWSDYVPTWIHEDLFITNHPSDKICEVRKSHFAKGGITLVKIDELNKIGGFDVNLGMKGEKIMYGEDTMVVEKLLNQELPVFYDPSIKMFHRSHHSTIREFIFSFWSKGRSNNIVYNKISILKTILNLIKSLFRFPLEFIRNLKKYTFKVALLLSLKHLVMSFSTLYYKLRNALK